MYKNIDEKSIYGLKKPYLEIIVKLVFKKSEGKLMKKCPKCGAFVGKTQAKCRNCGCDLLSPEPVKKVVQPKVEAPKPAPQVEAKPAPTPAPTAKPAGKVLVARKVEGVIEIVICPRCGGKNAASAAYCSRCGQKLGVLEELQEEKKEEPKLVKCPHCEKDNAEDAIYCAYCGKSLVEEPIPEVVSEPEPVEEPVVEETPIVDEVEVAPIAVEEAEVKEEQPTEIEEVSTNVEEEKKEEEKKPLVPFTKLSRLSVILMLVATMILGVLPILVVNVNSLGGFDNAFMTYIDALINFNTQLMFTYYSMAIWFILPMVVCVIYAIVAFGMLIFNIVKGFDKYRNYSTLFAPTVAFAFYFMMITAASASSWNFFFSASLWPNMIIAILIILATILGIVANILRKVERKNANLLSTQTIIKTVFGYVGAAIVLAGLFLMFTDAYFAATVAYFMRQDVTSTPPDLVPFIFGALNSIIVPIFMASATRTLIGLSTDGVRYRSAIAGASFVLASYVFILVGAIVTNSISGLAIVTYVFLALSVIILVAASVLGYFKRKEDKALLQEYVE